MESVSERSRADGSTALPVATLVLVSAGAALLVVGDLVAGLRGADAASMLALVVGWVLAAWGMILLGVVAVSIVRRSLAGRPTAHVEVLLALAAVVVTVALIVTQPLWGAGSASA